jgi:hypothetical protein
MDIGLSESQILGALRKGGVPARVVEFKDICSYASIDALLQHGPAVVYVAVTAGYGHWTACFERAGTVHVFDSSGKVVDADLLTLDVETRRQLHETEPCLMELLLKSSKPVDVNSTPLQCMKAGVETCGRWVTYRLLHQDLSDDAFVRLVESQRQGSESDDSIIVRLTKPIFGE